MICLLILVSVQGRARLAACMSPPPTAPPGPAGAGGGVGEVPRVRPIYPSRGGLQDPAASG